MKEQEARKKVKALKKLYTDLITYLLVNAILVLLWLAFDNAAPFWPKYVIVVWGLILAFKAYLLGIIPLILHRMSFLTPEWEEKKIQDMMKGQHAQRKIQLNRGVKK